MSPPENKKEFAFDRPGIYRIRVQGFIDERWSDRFCGMRITTISAVGQKGPATELVGKVCDQAELFGVLDSLYNMHLPLLSVEFLEDD